MPAPCWSRRPGRQQGARTAARLLRAHPRQARPPGRGRRGRAQARRALLASADQGGRLSLGAPGAGRQQDAAPWNCRPGSRQRRATGAARPTPTTSRRCATRRRGRRASRARLRAVRRALAPRPPKGRIAPQAERALSPRADRQRQRRVNARWRPARALRDGVRRRLKPAGHPWAARRRLQPTRRSSPRGRLRSGRIAPDRRSVLSISSVECSFARCCCGKVM